MKRRAEVITAVVIVFIALGFITTIPIVYQQAKKGAVGDNCTTQKIIVPIWLGKKCVPTLQRYDCNETKNAELFQCDLFEGTRIENRRED